MYCYILFPFRNYQEVFHHVVEMNVVRYIAAVLDYVSADILKVYYYAYIYIM